MQNQAAVGFPFLALGMAFIVLGITDASRQAFLFIGIAFLFIAITFLARARRQPPSG